MTYRSVNIATTAPYLVAVLLSTAFVLMIPEGPRVLAAQQNGRQQAATKKGDPATLVARGKYIVKGVAGCGYCHTPRDQDGNPDDSRWLEGAPVFYEPARPLQGWANTAPRIAGLPPGSDAELIKLLTTSVSRTGKPPRWPMPRFYMTRTDAEAVLAYLKSLDVKH
ncbi:MAG TPA: cytochrome c [Candidatus Eisenbacteria bacterium]|jgi:mono/diheme cytochrome c family protein|nr:cytochrome c [Bryobacteraceae bacterium]HXT26560.1 cytochrome c [Candidatus Eisenbacteria bacterium]